MINNNYNHWACLDIESTIINAIVSETDPLSNLNNNVKKVLKYYYKNLKYSEQTKSFKSNEIGKAL